ncbi:MAG: ATP-binding protein, partial [Candidatus Electrothrix sp. AR4]|nr:ATP-binding protein [Candidatus Electrothrix sp. AR4]
RNAVKYAGEAGPIMVSAIEINDQVAISVKDLGPGVPEGYLDRLFEPFFRPEPSRDRDSGGVGLGMAIVKTCTAACNGTVSARNREPKGFAVTVTLTS